jgi:hypothetical protein
MLLLQAVPVGSDLDATTKAARLCTARHGTARHGTGDHCPGGMTSAPRIVVIGASYCRVTAAETLRQEGFDGEIVTIGDERRKPHPRQPLSKQILHGEWEPKQISIHTLAKTDELDIDLRTSCGAAGLD